MIRLLDSEWERIRQHFPEENIPDGRPGRKPVATRLVLEAVLWILNTGAQWHMLPQYYPNYKTVHRRFQTWCRNEILRQVLTDIANELRECGAQLTGKATRERVGSLGQCCQFRHQRAKNSKRSGLIGASSSAMSFSTLTSPSSCGCCRRFSSARSCA